MARKVDEPHRFKGVRRKESKLREKMGPVAYAEFIAMLNALPKPKKGPKPETILLQQKRARHARWLEWHWYLDMKLRAQVNRERYVRVRPRGHSRTRSGHRPWARIVWALAQAPDQEMTLTQIARASPNPPVSIPIWMTMMTIEAPIAERLGLITIRTWGLDETDGPGIYPITMKRAKTQRITAAGLFFVEHFWPDSEISPWKPENFVKR